MVKIVGIDLDGTLLTDDKKICERNIRVIKEAVQKGVKIVLCSGRSRDGMKREMETLQLVQEGQYGVGLNGGVVFRTWDSKLLHKGHMDEDAARAIILRARELSDEVNLQLYDGNSVFVERWDDTTDLYQRYTGSIASVVPDLMALCGNVVKIGLFRRGEIDYSFGKIQETKAKMTKALPEGTTAAITAPYLVEFYSENTNKGSGIEILMEELGIPREETMGIGDLENDIPLLQTCGIGVAVQNAVPKVKEAADYITAADNNQGGVAEAIELFALKESKL